MSIRYGLLSLLERRPMHGYQLRQEFEASTGSAWPLNIGQVYTTLGRLERDGLVAPDDAAGEPSQRVYTITAAGRAGLEAWFGSPVHAEAAPRDELAIKVALAASTPGVDVRSVIQTQRAAAVRALQLYTRGREATQGDLPALLVADSLIFAAEAQVRWLDHCEARVARAARPAAPAEPAREVTTR